MAKHTPGPDDAPELVSKAEAAVLLGRHERSINRHVAAGRLARVYRPDGRGGVRAMFRRADVAQLARALTEDRADEPRPLVPLTRPAGVTPARVTAELAEAIARAIRPEPRGPMLLTVGAAARRAGVTPGDITRAVAAGELATVQLVRGKRATSRGRGLRIRPGELRRWVDAL